MREGGLAPASPADALGAIQALGPPLQPPRTPVEARAYAPLPGPGVVPAALKPHPVDEQGDTLGALTAEPPTDSPAAADDPDPAARLALINRSLERVDGGQMKALAAIDRSAASVAARDAAIVAKTGLDPAKLASPRAQAGVGGPFIPAEVDPNAPAFDQTLSRVARDVATAERLRALMPFMPVRMPLFGDASITSPFGYRADPFLGRLALHPGVDLTEAYGAEIHATAAGRVTHAGPMGGYGVMVEIDHGNGLVNPLRPYVESAGRGRPGRASRARCLARSGRAAARPGRISTMRCASTANRSIPSAICAPAPDLAAAE